LEPSSGLAGIYTESQCGSGTFTINPAHFNRGPTSLTDGYLVIEFPGSTEIKGQYVPPSSYAVPANFVVDRKYQPIVLTEPGNESKLIQSLFDQ